MQLRASLTMANINNNPESTSRREKQLRARQGYKKKAMLSKNNIAACVHSAKYHMDKPEAGKSVHRCNQNTTFLFKWQALWLEWERHYVCGWEPYPICETW